MEKEKKSGLATAGMILGIIAICTSFMPIINNLSFVMGVLSIVFGFCTIKKASKGKVITVIIMGVLAIVFTIKSQNALVNDVSNMANNTISGLDTMAGGKTEELLETSINVDFGTFSVEKESYIEKTQLPIKVTNKTAEQKSFSIEIEAVDSNGIRIGTDTLYVNNLNAGQTQEIKTFEYIDSSEVSKMQNATYKVVSISMY